MNKAINQLAQYVEVEGPFDGVIGYSQGASLAATYMIHYTQKYPRADLPFKCAIFFSGGKPLNPNALSREELEFLDPDTFSLPLMLPTAHIWGRNDLLWPGSSENLWRLCDPGQQSMFLHDEGHDIPGPRAKDALLGSVRVIRRTLEKALLTH
jgi:predicted esterase